MHFLNLVEAITKNLTMENVGTMVSLVEKLVTLGESMLPNSSDKAPGDKNSSNNAG